MRFYRFQNTKQGNVDVFGVKIGRSSVLLICLEVKKQKAKTCSFICTKQLIYLHVRRQ